MWYRVIQQCIYSVCNFLIFWVKIIMYKKLMYENGTGIFFSTVRYEHKIFAMKCIGIFWNWWKYDERMNFFCYNAKKIVLV